MEHLEHQGGSPADTVGLLVHPWISFPLTGFEENLLEMKPRARNPATNRAAPVAMAEREMPRSSKDRAEVHEAITKADFQRAV